MPEGSPGSVQLYHEGAKERFAETVYGEALAGMYEGVSREEISRAMMLAARARTEREPEYSHLAARLLLSQIYAEALGSPVALRDMERLYPARFVDYLRTGVECGRLDPPPGMCAHAGPATIFRGRCVVRSAIPFPAVECVVASAKLMVPHGPGGRAGAPRSRLR